MRSRRALCFVTAVLLCAGCGEKGEQPRRSSTGIYEDAFRIGTGISAEGIVINETSIFKQGDPIHASFVVQNAPEGARARVVWMNVTGGNTKMAEEEKPLGKKGFVSFSVADTSRWEPGDYRLEKSLIGDASKKAVPSGIGIKDFKVVAHR